MSISTHGFAASTHWQKFRRLTVLAFAGIPFASVTCSRRYFGWNVCPSDGFALPQHFSSLNGSSPLSSEQMKAKKLSLK
ncbi:hypothetical protein D3C79_912220 [compost metagenome]